MIEALYLSYLNIARVAMRLMDYSLKYKMIQFTLKEVDT